MRQFDIYVRSFRQVQEFVALAMVQPFEVLVSCGNRMVNGKSFMGIFTLDHRRPLQVTVRCTDEEYGKFLQETSRIFA